MFTWNTEDVCVLPLIGSHARKPAPPGQFLLLPSFVLVDSSAVLASVVTSGGSRNKPAPKFAGYSGNQIIQIRSISPEMLKFNMSPSYTLVDANATNGFFRSVPSWTTAPSRGYLHLLMAAAGMVTLTLTAVIANLLVILIFVKHRRLRRCKNVYLVGLSLADLGVGLVMPVALADEMLQDWAPSGVGCKCYLVIRDSLLFISLLSVVQVSVDRWWSTHRPFNYRVRQSKSMAATVVAVTWATTFVIHIPITGLYDLIHILVAEPANWKGPDEDRHFAGRVNGPGSVVPQTQRTRSVQSGSGKQFCNLITSVLCLGLQAQPRFRGGPDGVPISQRKMAKVRRSISGIDTVLFTLLKASSSDSECNASGSAEENHMDILRAQRLDRRLSRLSPAPLNRRHTMSQIVLPGMSYSPCFASSPRQSRPLRRRVSLQDCLQSSGYSSSLQVPRRKSHGLTQSLSDSLLPTSRRQSRDDLARDLLLKQDKKAACFLGMLQAVLFVCWTPVTVVTIVNAATESSVVPAWVDSASLWVLLSNSAINPFLYGLLNSEFSKVVKHWFKIKGSKRGRLKTALRKFSMHIAWELEKNMEQTTFETVRE
ncbi:hypothetical protein C0Q70_06395 [Pomacea canaliculata]|uniref:G-protein coupled receptors family 1 profile domain-containing protein n=1 Tax=Pomacea canaliculata TaxID=400727 RepID=A0A2T7PNV7_POMCA|nr:hypothetical protein C0Q70_06395 [Pomacea canaliculata]